VYSVFVLLLLLHCFIFIHVFISTLVIPKQRGCIGCIVSGLSSLPAYQYHSCCVSVQSLSPIRRGFAPDVVNYKKGCTRLAVACDKVYQLLAHGRWFFPCTPTSSTTKTGRRDIAEILLKVALNTKIHPTT
jgi:hypothetical protein